MKDYMIAGPSTIEPNIFGEALAHRKSPVSAIYMEAWNLCRAWGVNPAVALGFFVNESNAGTEGIAVKTLNWGNLRKGPGQLDTFDDFSRYGSWIVSLNDWCKLLRGPLYEGAGLLTVEQVTPIYAPSDDHNDPLRYATIVNYLCAGWEAMRGSA